MKLDEVLYTTPEMTEEKLLKIIDGYMAFLKKDTKDRLIKLFNKRHKGEKPVNLPSVILEEWDLIQQKQSYLSKSQRDQISGLVGLCLIQMTKGDEQIEEKA